MIHSKTSLTYITPKIVLAFLAACIIVSCENKIDLIPKSDLLTLPSLKVKDFETIFTDSGKIQLIMHSSLMEEYKNSTTPYTEFREGIVVLFHDGEKDPVASVTSKYARYTEADNLWELKDSVVVINEANDKLETEVLFWDQTKDLIYTDRFVKITNTDQEIHGYGFESDSHLKKRKIKKVRATINIKNEE